MPTKLLAFVSKHPEISDHDKLTLIAIMCVWPDRYPSSKMLADAVGVHRKTIMRGLSTLRKLGFIGGDGRRRVGIGEIQEICLDPLWDAFAAKHPEDISVADLIQETSKVLPVSGAKDEPSQILPAPIPSTPINMELSDAEFARLYGPPGATAEDAQVVRRVAVDFNNSVADLDDEIVASEAERMALAAIEAKALRALDRHMPLTTEESLNGKILAKERMPAAIPRGQPTSPEEAAFLGFSVTAKNHINLPAVLEAPALLRVDSLSSESQSKFYEETLRHVIALCYPLWDDHPTFKRYQDAIEEAYAEPCCSHQEVWGRVQATMIRYIKQRAIDMKYDWRVENETFGRIYNRYAEACALKGADPLDVGVFREEFYRHGKHREYQT